MRNNHSRVIAVDWSGARRGAHRKIWLAEARPGRLRRLESGRSRKQLVAHLIEEAGRDPNLVVGLDFAFSFPHWFIAEQEAESIGDVWSLGARQGEVWLGECNPPFWGRPGRKKPDHDSFRRTERDVQERFGSQPKSVFQVGGSGAVGTMSIRGMPFLAELSAAGFNVWPFDPAEPPFVLEIYPRLLKGDLVKSDLDARIRHLRGAYPELDEVQRATAACSEDALDAAVSAIVMTRHLDGILALEHARNDVEALEGRIWYPEGRAKPRKEAEARSSASAVEARDDCPFCTLPASNLLHTSRHARAFRDAYPVSNGHTLVVPTRHVASLWDLEPAERTDLWTLVDVVRDVLAASHGPDGFNIGVNDGEAAGQTVAHAHVHVIPRYVGDVADPRGGIRWVVPGRANYWEEK